MVKPTDCRMPDLGDLSVPILSHYMLKVTFHGTGTSNNRAHRSYIVLFIRVLDKAIHEYDQSRKELQAYIGSANKTTLLMKAVSHLETCVNSLRRCLRLFKRMKELRVGDVDERRQLRNYIEAIDKSFEEVRHASEHMDDCIADCAGRPRRRAPGPRVTEGQPIALMFSEAGDRASIAGEEISFSVLASTLRKLHGFAVQLCDYRDPATNP
jgi:hypothetical protein